MNRSLLAIALALLAAPVRADEPSDPWRRSHDDAVRAAKAAGKPVFLVFRCER